MSEKRISVHKKMNKLESFYLKIVKDTEENITLS
jgi:hypothetical protein